MKHLVYFLLIFPFLLNSQSALEVEFNKKQILSVDRLVQIDNFGTLYYINDNILYKVKDGISMNYSNVQFGEITSAVIFNPLKIHLFYKDFNSIIVLDNRLAELTKVDFNTLETFRSVSLISTANDNAIWLFNQNTQQMELFDYLARKTKITTLPVTSEVIDIASNYNRCWLLTENYLYTYNYTGSIISKLPNNGYQKIEENNGNIFMLKDKNLYFLPKNSVDIERLNLPELLINQFLVTNETLYIYADEMLHQFQLKTE